jgi:hypothetical protein
MKRKARGRFWSWFLILLLLVAAGLAGYFLHIKRPDEASRAEKKEFQASKRIPGPAEPAPRPEPETPAVKETVLPKEAEKIRTPVEKDFCTQIENDVLEFFRYLDKKTYIQGLQADRGSFDRFKELLWKLSTQPPIPAGEGLDSRLINRNIFHFFRLLDRDDLRLIKEILIKEADTLEMNLDIFYRWLMLGDRCPDREGIRPSLDVLYQYSGFFLNTIGGRAYIFRRPLDLRLLISYYSLLIVHEADKRGENSYGIDIFPEINALTKEITIYPDFQLQNEYIHQLAMLQNYYLDKR